MDGFEIYHDVLGLPILEWAQNLVIKRTQEEYVEKQSKIERRTFMIPAGIASLITLIIIFIFPNTIEVIQKIFIPGIINFLPKNETDVALVGVATAFLYMLIAFMTRYIRYKAGLPIPSSSVFYAGLPMNSFHFATAAIIMLIVASPNYTDLIIEFRMLLLLAGLTLLISTIGWLAYAWRGEDMKGPAIGADDHQGEHRVS